MREVWKGGGDVRLYTLLQGQHVFLEIEAFLFPWFYIYVIH